MNTWKPGKFFLKLAAFLALLTAFAILDWYPAVKELGRLRRQYNDLLRSSNDHAAMAARFVFSDAEEQSVFFQCDARLRQTLLRVETDAAWLGIVLPELVRRVGAARIDQAYFWVSPDPDSDPEEHPARREATDLDSWLAGQRPEILSHFRRAAKSTPFPWRFLLSGVEHEKNENLASRPLIIVLGGDGLLADFINRCSWSEARLEILHLHLELTDPFPRAWMICRGQYLIGNRSPWVVANEKRGVRYNLLIDPDSPLLWQKVDPSRLKRIERRELARPPDSSR